MVARMLFQPIPAIIAIYRLNLYVTEQTPF